VACLLIVLVAVPAVLILALTGQWVTDATRSAGAYGQVGRLAALGQQVDGLALAMADEESGTAAFISGGRPAAGLAALHRQYAITDARAARVRRLVSQLGTGYPAQTQAGAAQVLASIAKLPGLRSQAAQSQAPALAVIAGYSAAASGLFPVSDGIADLSGNSTLIISVRALSSLSMMIVHASQQQAILGVAIAEGRFGPGALTALTTARAQQASDLASFRNSATSEESWALTQTLARPLARQAQAVEQRATAAGNGVLALGPQASQQWSAGMSYTVGWMGHDQQQLAEWLTADAQVLRRSAMQSAIIAGVAGLGAVALVVLGTVFAARSMVRRRRRLDAAALEAAGERLPISASDVSAGFYWRNHSLLERLLRLIDSLELNEEDPERLASLFEMDHLATRIWRNADSARALAGHETRRPAEPLALVDVLRGAASEIAEYGRIDLDVQQGVYVGGSAATDTVHLLAELLENATTFSPETTQVVVSGHAVSGGGSLITITDGGTGMSEEELTLLNWQLANPSLADMAVARHMGLFAVALLAARHGITVTLSMPPDGGTTAEVYLPAELTSLDAVPGGWQGQAGEALMAGAGEEASAAVADLPFSALRFASGPEPPYGPENDAPEAVPVMLSAPVPAPAPETSADEIEPEPASAEPGDGPPIFESVRSGYPQDFGWGLLRFGEQQAGPSPAERPARPPASWGEETRQDSVAESAEITRSKLASFQRGSRRARTAARMNRGEQQPGRDG
jgi:signal transduction histidine kinase